MFHGSCFCNGRNPPSTLPIPCCFTSSLNHREYNTCSKRNKNFEQKAKQKEGKSKILSKGKPENKNVQNFTRKKLRKTEKIGKKQIKKIKQKNKKLREKKHFSPAKATLSSLPARRTPKTVAKCRFFTCRTNPLVTSDVQNRCETQIFTSRSNPLATSCSSDVQHCGGTQIFHVAKQPFRHFVLVGCPRL